MPLTPGQRIRAVTRARVDRGLIARRVAAGGAITAVATAIGFGLHGLVSLLGLVVAIPGVYTLVAARRPWVAPCPACGLLLGRGVLAFPDEAVVGPRSTDIRCPACGIYVDSLDGEVREVPFNRRSDTPEYTLVFDASALPAIAWGEVCLRCARPATRGLGLNSEAMGVLTTSAKVGDWRPGLLPLCAEHGAALKSVAEVVVVARAGARVTVQFSLYAAYRAFLDANRDRVDVQVRALPTEEGDGAR